MYAILDIETTGLNSVTERITEIAIYIHDGKQIIDQFETLINPEKRIPFQIIGLTGIDNRMVVNAPRFCEVAKKIVEFTEGKIIVGHNVTFDYGFLRHEYKRLFFDYKRKTVCTKKLARKFMKGRSSYGLGTLARDLNIKINGRHRAAGDAMATVKLFEYLNSLSGESINASLKGHNSNLNKAILDNLPERIGVYYLLDKAGEVIYIGKSNTIRSRIISHLNNNSTKRAIDMKDQVADIHYELTGSELIALLLESDEIKKHKPVYNRLLRKVSFPYGLFDTTDKKGYINLSVRRIKQEDNPLTSYTNLKEGREHINYLVETHNLCQKLSGVHKADGPCFYNQIYKCNGACVGKESVEDYNIKANEAIDRYLYHNKSFYIIDIGRRKNERAIVKVTNGRYKGYGYINVNNMNYAESIIDCIKEFPDNKDAHVIIKGYLRKHKPAVTILKIQDSTEMELVSRLIKN